MRFQSAGYGAVLICLLLSSHLRAADIEKVALIGDSTVATRSGWGDSFGRMLSADVSWVNMARGGRSSKSFRDEGWWQKTLDENPTWVFIQFGHNDQPGKGPQRETDPATTFPDNLTRYVNEARAAGARPVLVSSLTRRFFDSHGQIDPERLEPVSIPEGFRLTDYARAAIAVAEQLDVPLIDLNALSVRQMNRMGPEAAASFDPKPKDPQSPDRTHLNEHGAAATARLVANEVCRVIPEFVPLLKGGRCYRFDFTNGDLAEGALRVTSETAYDKERGYGFVEMNASSKAAAIFSTDIDEGNYQVTMRFGAVDRPTSTTVKAEARRLLLENAETQAGEFVTRTFTINVRRPEIANGSAVKLNSRETGPPLHTSWDEQLSFEFNGPQPGVASLAIVPTDEALTVFIAGDSTVTDQRHEPYAGWGQMLPRFFAPDVAISNHAESGLALRSFESQRRLAKLLSMLQPGDYVLIQFGHNDQKDSRDGAGPFTTYRDELVRFIEAVRNRHGLPVLVTSMERLRMDSNGVQTPTLADYAAAVRQVGAEQNVPVIDLNAMSLQFYAALGPQRCTTAFAFYPAGTFPDQDKELADRTHHNSYGAYELARCVVRGIQQQVPDLAVHLAADAGMFDPAAPDDPDNFDLLQSPVVSRSEKPSGN